MSEQRFRINAENVVHEAVDGEVIAIDLANGCYYSLSGSAPAIWEMLGAGASAAELCAVLASRFEAEPGTIEAAVSELLERLRESALIIASEDASAAPSVADGGDLAPFEAPAFERYDDMKDYFLLDPIHEVGEAGWPKPAP